MSFLNAHLGRTATHLWRDFPLIYGDFDLSVDGVEMGCIMRTFAAAAAGQIG